MDRDPPTGDPDAVPVLQPTRARWPVYAERPRRRIRQFVADVAALTWAAVVVSAAILLHDTLLALQEPGRRLGGAGAEVRDTFTSAADTASGVPFVGEDLARSLSNGTRAGDSLVSAGDQVVSGVDTLATVLAWVLVVLALVPVVALWATLRVRWMLAARLLLQLRDGAVDADLLALRALTNGSPRRLRRAAPDAAAAWRRGDPYVLARLADVELGRLGLRGPSLVRAPRALSGADPEKPWGDTPPPPGPDDTPRS